MPVCLPAILDIAIYLFVNAMTTVSAVIFLYSTDTKLASVAVVNMDDAGTTAAAAAMAMMIVYTSAGVRAAARAADAGPEPAHAGMAQAVTVVWSCRVRLPCVTPHPSPPPQGGRERC